MISYVSGGLTPTNWEVFFSFCAQGKVLWRAVLVDTKYILLKNERLFMLCAHCVQFFLLELRKECRFVPPVGNSAIK